MNRPKKHHHLSRFYVEGFTDDGNLFVLSKQNNKIFPSNPRDVFKINNFYFLDNFEDPLMIENSLALLEGKVAPILKRVCSSTKFNLNEEEYNNFIEWISWLYVSRPKQRDLLDSALGQVEEISRAILKDKKVREEDSSTLEEVKKLKGNKNFHIKTSVTLFEDKFSLFKYFEWGILILKNNLELITSDNPFCRFPRFPHGKVPSWFIPEFHTLILFPLSKNCLLVGAGLDLNFDFNELNSLNYIHHINSIIYASSQKFIVAAKKELLDSL